MVNVAALLQQDLHTTVDALCAADIDQLSETELATAAIEIQLERHRLAAVSARILDRWNSSKLWSVDGSRSAASCLARDTHCSKRSAQSELRRARTARHMPEAITAVMNSEMSADHLDLLAKAVTPQRREQFAADQTLLVNLCRTLSFSDATKAVTYWCHRVDADRERESESGNETSTSGSGDVTGHLHASTTFNNNLALTGELDPIRGAIFTQELARLEHEIYLADTANGITRTTSQRNAEALTQMAIRSASTPADAKKPRPLFTVLLGDDTFSHLCELANNTVLPSAALGKWLAEADLETVLFDGPSTVISVSHKRTFTGALRRAIEVRDRHCTHPSVCDIPADNCDVDHIVPASQNGPTSQFNGRMQCPTHNRNHAKHDHGATPFPHRPVTALDNIRGRLRWNYNRNYNRSYNDHHP